MALEEKSAWIMGLVAIATYGLYVWALFTAAEGGPINTPSYKAGMITTIGIGILTNIVLSIIVGIFSPRKDRKKDNRDREIYRFGEYVGHFLLIAGGIGALILAMLEVDQFWIANEIYLAFVLATVLASVMKIIGYRAGFQKW